MWSDPEDIETWAVSPRGAGWLFGRKVTSEFNQINGEQDAACITSWHTSCRAAGKANSTSTVNGICSTALITCIRGLGLTCINTHCALACSASASIHAGGATAGTQVSTGLLMQSVLPHHEAPLTSESCTAVIKSHNVLSNFTSLTFALIRGCLELRTLRITEGSILTVLYCTACLPSGLDLICRAHQLVQEGLKYMFPDQSLVTVWSAPNYCYRCGNVASILIFDDNLQRDVRYFTETAENSTMMQPRVPSRYFW